MTPEFPRRRMGPSARLSARPTLAVLRRAALLLAAVAASTAALPLSGAGQASDPALGQAADPAAVMEKASVRYAAAGTVCADFHQVMSVPLLDQRMEGRGRLCQKGADLFSMRFTEPSGDLVVIDGENAWLYYPSRDPDQVLKAPLSATGGGRGLDIHREFLEDAQDKYEMTYRGMETVDGRRVHRIFLRPRDRARFREATVWIEADGHILRRVEVLDDNGSLRTVSLSGVDLDASAPAGTFSFTPPPGARIITP